MPELITLAPGVEAMYIENLRFKTTRISVSFFLPLRAETLSANAILPYLLASCCRQYPDFSALNNQLNHLYGASLSADTDKIADYQVLRLSIAALDDKYTLDGQSISGEVSALLAALLFDPSVEKSSFLEADMAREKRLMLERIEGEINNKRRYAIRRCEAEMCKGEPYGLPPLGTKEGAEALTGAGVYAAWERILREAYIRIHVVGSTPPDRLWTGFRDAFALLKRTAGDFAADNIVVKSAGAVRQAEDKMDVTQGKLVMGFRTGCAGGDADTLPLMVMGDLFGGGPYSRLFANVREKLSLCYYCAARVNRRKGILLVDSGVEQQNAEKAREEILRQLEVMQNGGFEDSELSASLMSLGDTLKSVPDTPGETDRWYLDRVFDRSPMSPAQVGEALGSVTKEQVVEAACKVTLDTVYMLSPKEAARE